jgi:hypothetical protein
MVWLIVGIVIIIILIVSFSGILRGKSTRNQSSRYTVSGAGSGFWSGDSSSGSDGCGDSGGGGGDGGGCD